MAILTTFDKQPLDVQDYDLNCNSWLTSLSDTILSIDCTVTTGITLISASHTSGIVKVWLSGGNDGTTYTVTLLITTVGQRVKQAEYQVKVKDK